MCVCPPVEEWRAQPGPRRRVALCWGQIRTGDSWVHLVFTWGLFLPQMMMQYLYYGGTEALDIPAADILEVRPLRWGEDWEPTCRVPCAQLLALRDRAFGEGRRPLSGPPPSLLVLSLPVTGRAFCPPTFWARPGGGGQGEEGLGVGIMGPAGSKAAQPPTHLLTA